MRGDARTRAYDFFVSYAHADEGDERVRRLAAGLGLPHYIDYREIRTGEDFRRNIQDGLVNAVSFLAFVSPAYLASSWCRLEWQAWTQQLGVYRSQTDMRRIVLVEPIPGFDSAGDPEELARRFAESRGLELDADALDTVSDVLRAVQMSLYVLPDDAEALTKLGEDLGNDGATHREIEATPETIPPYNWNFVGRREEMERLRDLLGAGNRTGVIHGIHGLGGMGKTELAIAYAHRFARDYPAGRFWIRCDERGSLRDALLSESSFTIRFWGRISEEQRKQPEIYYEALKLAIGRAISESGPMLLVLDNVTDRHVVSREEIDGLGAFHGRLHLLATTRLPSPAGADWVSLDRLPEADALALLARHRPFGTEEDREAAVMLVRKLGGFTLAVELVGAWAAVHRTGFQRIAQSVDLDALEDLAGDDEVSLRRHARESLRAILSPVIDGLAPLPLRVLQLSAFLPPDLVALPWLRELTREDDAEDALLDPFDEAVRVLQSWSLFSAADPAGRLVRVHRLVQELTIERIAPQEREPIGKSVADYAIGRTNGLDREQNWMRDGWELEPLEALAWQWEETGHARAGTLLNDVGNCLQNASQWSRAEAVLRRAFAIGELRFGPDHPVVATHLNNLASLLQATNRLTEAEPMVRRALAIHEQSYGPDHPRVATDLNNLATVLQDTNRLAEAEPLFRRALAIDEQSYGPDHPEVAADLNNLAELLRSTNRLGEAEPMFRRALSIDEGSLGPNHPTVAIRLSNLALLLQATNRLAEAEPMFRRALAIDEQSLGPDHPNVAVRLSSLAALLYATKRLAEAEPLFRRALAIAEQSLGPDHPTVAIRLNNLARLLQDTNRLSEAEPLARRMLSIFVAFERLHGHRHRHFEVAANNYAGLLSDAGFEQPEVTVAVALVAPEIFEPQPPPEQARAGARDLIAQARRDGRTFVADTLENILRE